MKKSRNTLKTTIEVIIEKQKFLDSISISPIKLIFDTSEIAKLQNLMLPDLTPFTKAIDSQLSSISRAFTPIFEQIVIPESLQKTFITDISKLVENIYSGYLDSFLKLSEKINQSLEILNADAKEIAPLLQSSGLWLSTSMSLHLLRLIIETAKNPSSTPNDLEKVYTDYYSENQFENLKSLIDSWRGNNHFKNRFQIIEDAFEAHKAQKYTLSVPALLPLVEGIACSIAGVSAGHPTKTIKEVIGKNYPDFLQCASKDLFLNLLESIGLFGNIDAGFFSPEKFSNYLLTIGIVEEKSLNRHAILHGVQNNYSSEFNSLRLFLILDMLSDLDNK